MKSRIEKLSKGTIEYEKPQISLSMDRITEVLQPGKLLSMDMMAQSVNNVPIQVFFYSNQPRVKVTMPHETGRHIKFTVEVSTMGLHEGDKLEGRIDAVYNGGEFSIPYDFTIGVIRSSKAPTSFESMDAFYAFYQEHPEDAIRIFDWKDFSEVPFMADLHLHALYSAYVDGRAKDGGLVEFFRALGYKIAEKNEQPLMEESLKENKLPKRTEYDEMHFARPLRMLQLYLGYSRSLLGCKEKDVDYRQKFNEFVRDYQNDSLSGLLYTWYLMQEGELDKARKLLIGLQDPVQQRRVENKDVYCLFLYLTAEIQQDEAHKENVARLVHRYFMDGTSSVLMYYLEYKLNQSYQTTANTAFEFLNQHYYKSNFSPLILQETALLLEKNGDTLFRTLTEFEMDAMIFGVRHGILSEKNIFRMLSHELMNQKLVGRYMLLLKLAAKRYESPEFLRALVKVYLQQKCIGPEYFVWYERAIRRNITLNGLFEYYMVSRPKDRNDRLPESLVRYFAEGRKDENISSDDLYENVITYYRDDPEIMDLYREKLQNCALRRMKEESFTVEMIPMFQLILHPDFLTSETAPYMLELFKLKEIRTTLDDAVNVIVYYPQLAREVHYPLRNRKALVPVFSSEAVILFETVKGRKLSDIDSAVLKVYDDIELEKQCFLYAEESYLMQMSEVDEILKNGIKDERGLMLVTELIKNKKTDAFYKARLYEALIDMSEDPEMNHIDCMAFLLEADFNTLRPEYQSRLMNCLIEKKYYEAAFRRVLIYGSELLSDEALSELLTAVMEHPVSDNDVVVTFMCRRLMDHNMATGQMLRYLAQYYNGSTTDMVTLLRILRRKKQPLHDLTERTLMLCLYADRRKDLDSLFEWHAADIKRNPKLLEAALVLRSHEYFLKEHKLTEMEASELKKYVFHLPKIAELALLSWYAEEDIPMSADDRTLAEKLLKHALDNGIMLGAYSELKKKIEYPQELEGRVFIEYRDRDAVAASVNGSILPKTAGFQRTMSMVYPGVFVKSFILYSGEWMKYNFSVQKKDGSVTTEESDQVISAERKSKAGGSRYEDVLRLEQKVSRGDMRDCAELLRSLLLKDEMINDIFGDPEE